MKLFKMLTPPIKASVIALLAFSVFADGTYEGSWIGLSGKVTIPAGVSAPVTATELADFANVTEIVFADAEGAVTASGLTAELVLNATLSGAGAFTATGCTKVTINSNNKAFAGRFAFNNTPVYVSKRYGLGSAAEGDGKCVLATEAPASGTSKMDIVFTGTGDDLRLENDITATNPLKISPESTTDILIINANLTQQSKNQNINFANKVRMEGGTLGNAADATHFYSNVGASGEFWLDEGATVYAANSIYWASGGGTIHLKGTLNLGSNFAVYNAGIFICEKENVLNTKPVIYSGVTNPKGRLDLNGFDQTTRSIGFISGTVSGPTYYPFHSDTPATLNIVPTTQNQHTDGAHPFFTGRVSVNFAPTGNGRNIDNWFVADVADGTKTHVSTSKGTFTVTDGKFAFKQGWGWGGDVVVAGGTLTCESVASLVTTNGTLTVSGSGKLVIGAGVTLNVSGATFGEVTLPERYKTYTVAEIHEMGVPDTMLDGEGAVYVGAPSVLDDWTGWPSEGEARIPNDTVVDITDADVAKVANLDSILLGRGATIRCVNATVPLTVPATVTGAGTFTADGATSVTLAGDFSDVLAYGRLSFKDTAVTVAGASKLTIAASDMFAGECTLSLAGTAALEIAADAAPLVYGGTFGTAELENNVSYTTAELDALSDGNDVTGEGILHVGPKHIPGTWQGWPEVGTATNAEIPDGEVAEIAEEDVAKVEALSRIDLGFGSTIVLKTTATPLTLSARLAGVGTLTAANAAPLVLAGDNSRLIAPGAIAVTSTAVTVTHRYGLGGPNTGMATFYNALNANDPSKIDRNNNTLLIGNGECALTNDVPIEYTGSWILGAAYADFPWVQMADLRQTAGANNKYVWFTNRIVMASGAFGVKSSPLFSSSVGDGNEVTLESGSEIDVHNGSWYPLGGTVVLGNSAASMTEFHPNIVTYFSCTAPNVFGSDCTFKPYLSEKPYEWDLGGHDQFFFRLTTQNYDATKQGRIYALKSDIPATLTVSNGSVKAAAQLTTLKAVGKLSVHFAGRDPYQIADAVSTTEGALQVSGDCSVEFIRGAGFNVSTNIVIDGGTITVAEDAAETVFSRDANVTVTEGGKLVVADGRTVTVRALNLDGEWLPRGLWGGAAALDAGLIDADHCNSELFGSETTGVVKIRRSVTVGLTLIVR